MSNNRKQSKNESLESRLEFKLKLLKSGYDLFYEFFKLDCEATAKNLSSLINLNDQEEKQLVMDLVQLIADTEIRLYIYIGSYPRNSIIIDDSSWVWGYW